jgi:hypothetical protein
MNRLNAVLFVALLSSLLVGCKDSGTEPDTTTPPPATGGTVSFSGRILPTFTTFGCTGCHGGTSGLTVTSVASLLAGGAHGPAIVAGDAANSILYKKLLATPPFGARMPEGGPYLPDSTVAAVATWINEGAKNN